MGGAGTSTGVVFCRTIVGETIARPSGPIARSIPVYATADTAVRKSGTGARAPDAGGGTTRLASCPGSPCAHPANSPQKPPNNNVRKTSTRSFLTALPPIRLALICPQVAPCHQLPTNFSRPATNFFDQPYRRGARRRTQAQNARRSAFGADLNSFIAFSAKSASPTMAGLESFALGS